MSVTIITVDPDGPGLTTASAPGVGTGTGAASAGTGAGGRTPVLVKGASNGTSAKEHIEVALFWQPERYTAMRVRS